MTREVFEQALKEGIHSFYYIFKDFGIGRDCKHFVETGTYMGDAVNYAVGLGFEQIFSCELSEERYNHCLEKFKDNDTDNKIKTICNKTKYFRLRLYDEKS